MLCGAQCNSRCLGKENRAEAPVNMGSVAPATCQTQHLGSVPREDPRKYTDHLDSRKPGTGSTLLCQTSTPSGQSNSGLSLWDATRLKIVNAADEISDFGE